MARLVGLSVNSLGLACAAGVGLAAYTAHLPDDGLVAVSLPMVPSEPARLTPRPRAHTDGCAAGRKLVG
jgi:hypothetical protein